METRTDPQFENLTGRNIGETGIRFLEKEKGLKNTFKISFPEFSDLVKVCLFQIIFQILNI